MRQQTMYNTIRWSYDLLTPDEQYLFRCLSVFAGVFTLEVAEAFAELLDNMTTPILDNISSLLNKSLLRSVEQQDGERCLMMLETIREFGLECLAANDELQQVRDTHAAYYYARIQKIQLSAVNTMYASLEPEYENIVAALQWLLEGSKATDKANMVLAIVRVVESLVTKMTPKTNDTPLTTNVPDKKEATKHPSPHILTAREVEVLRLLAEGLKNSEIAKKLVISPNTVGIHVQSIYSKLGLSSRSEATRYAIEHHFV